jgi:hypothetical protein
MRVRDILEISMYAFGRLGQRGRRKCSLTQIRRI